MTYTISAQRLLDQLQQVDTGAIASSADRSANPARRGLPLDVRRMIGLETAAGLLGGQERLADALGISARGLRAKVSADRGVSDMDLLAAATALEQRATRICEHARKLREEAAPSPCAA